MSLMKEGTVRYALRSLCFVVNREAFFLVSKTLEKWTRRLMAVEQSVSVSVSDVTGCRG